MNTDTNASELALDLDGLRAKLLKLLLRVSALLGTFVYLPSVYLSLRQGLFGLAWVDTIALAAIFGLLVSGRMRFRVRAAAACLIYYALGVGLLISVGPISQIYLFGFSVVTVLLLGVRVGLGAAVLSSVSLFGVGAVGRAAATMAVAHWSGDLSAWLVITINFTLVNTLLTLAIGTLLAAVADSLKREIASGVSLDRKSKLLRTLIDSLPDVVFTKDTSGRFVNCNPATVALFGLDSEDQLAGKTVFDLCPRELAESYHSDDREVLAAQTAVHREEQSVDSKGNRLWYLTTKVPLFNAEGYTLGLLGISRDITDR